MSNTSLSEFAGRLRAKNRITFADVQRLRRDVLPDGITSREDTELLISLDRDVSRSNSEWEYWLVAMVVDFAVWTERPTGVVHEDTAFWLAATLNGQVAHATKTGRLIAREVIQEAEAFENEARSLHSGWRSLTGSPEQPPKLTQPALSPLEQLRPATRTFTWPN
jgi:hypothetical protein